MAIDFRKRDEGEFFVTFDEFYSLFNKFSVVFDLSTKNYERQTLVHHFSIDNCTGIKLNREEEGNIAHNVQYVLTINKKPTSNAHVIINFQQEDGRLKADAQTYDHKYTHFKKALYLGVFRLPGGATKVTSLSQAKTYCISYELMAAWVVGANLENLENGTYVIIPTFHERVVNKDTFKYFLTITTNLSQDEFKLEGPGTSLNDLMTSASASNLNFADTKNKQFIKSSSKLFTSKMIYTQKTSFNTKVRKGFLDMANYRALQANFTDNELEKQLIATPRSFMK
jgi:hypothetical protein